MSDLTDELQQVADTAACQARPLAVAEVIQRGNRRRHRTITQRSLGGLSVAGLSAAVFLTGATSNPAGPTAASASHGVITLTEQTASAAGQMTVVVRYRDEPHGRIAIVSGTYSGATAHSVRHPVLAVVLRVPSHAKGKKPGITGVGITFRLRPDGLRTFHGKLPTLIRSTTPHFRLTSGSQLTVTLGNMVKPGTKKDPLNLDTLMQAGLILS